MLSPLQPSVSGQTTNTGKPAKDLTRVRNGNHQRSYWAAMLFIATLFLAGQVVAQPLAFKHGFSLGYSADINQVVVDGAGNAYVLGSFENTADFEPGPGETKRTSAGNNDVFLAKYAPAGNLLWVNQVGNTFRNNAYNLILDKSGQLYISGSFKGTVDFDPSPNTANLDSEAGSTDIFMARYTPEGAYVWAIRLGGAQDYEFGSALAVDDAGHIYITGLFIDTIDLDPGPGTATLTSDTFAYDVFIAKYTTSGSFVWGNRLGNSEPELAQGLAVDAGGNVYITGIFKETVDFDPGVATANLASAGGYDIYIVENSVKV